jgi:hypothetical protein
MFRTSVKPADSTTVGAPRHSAELLAAFQDGERALVYARYRDDPTAPLYRLHDGEARQQRAWAKTHLECFMPDCPDRRLTTVSRHPRKRDGFSHYAGAGGHSTESLFHQQAKALIASWARQQDTRLVVAVEEATTGRERIADVMVTGPNGHRVAIEIQYSALTPDQWQARHDSYARQGIVDVWLFGHHGAHLRPDNGGQLADEGSWIRLSPLHEHVVAAQVPLLWINPITAQVATAVRHEAAYRSWDGAGALRRYQDGWDGRVATVLARSFAGQLVIDDLSNCRLTPGALVMPAWQTAFRSSVELAEVNARRQARDEARAAQQRADAQREADRQAAVIAREMTLAEDRAALDLNQWLASALRARLVETYGGIPDFLDYTPPHYAIHAHPQHWQALLYKSLILGKAAGTGFTVADVYKTLHRHDLGLTHVKGRLSQVVTGWLDHLATKAHVEVRRDFRSQRITWVKIVDRDAVLAQRAHAARQSDRRKAHSRARGMVRKQRQAGTLPAPEPLDPAIYSAAPPENVPTRAEAPSTAAVSSLRARKLTCDGCGGKLDPVLRRRGRHIGC